MNIIGNNSLKLTLFKKGRITGTLDFSMSTVGFHSFATIDLSQLDPQRLVINTFGVFNYLNTDFNIPIGSIINPGAIPPFQINTNLGLITLDCSYQLVGRTLSIGTLNVSFGAGYTIAAPFNQAEIDYYIFYY